MKGSPFKLRSPLQVSGLGGTINPTKALDQNLGKELPNEKTEQKTDTSLAVREGNTDLYTDSTKASTVADQVAAAKAGESKGSGNSAFDRDGRSVDKFDQRIADAESKGKLGRVQRLKNRKGGYMESQANKLEKAGGTLTNDQKIALNKAGEESGGTKAGKGLRAFFGRDAKQRKVDPVPVKKDDEDKDNDNNEFGNGFGPS